MSTADVGIKQILQYLSSGEELPGSVLHKNTAYDLPDTDVFLLFFFLSRQHN